jgi:hypothetical protein
VKLWHEKGFLLLGMRLKKGPNELGLPLSAVGWKNSTIISSALFLGATKAISVKEGGGEGVL